MSQLRWIRWLGLFLFCFCLFFTTFLSCKTNAPVSQDIALQILYTANVNGELERCGCSEEQLGGVSRRKTVIEEHRSDVSLLLDAGDSFFGSFSELVGSTEFYRHKSSAMVRSMNHLGYDAALMGDYDFALGKGNLLALLDEASFPFICANLLDAAGEHVAAPYRIINKGSLRIALIGFLDDHVVMPAYQKGLEDLRIDNPFRVAKAMLPELEKKSDLIVALVHFQVIEMASFFEQFPQIDIAILGHQTGDGKPVQMTKTLVVSGSALGKELGVIDLIVSPGVGIVEYAGRLIPVSETTQPDKELENIIDQFHQTVREKRFSETITFLTTASPNEKYVGAKECDTCHPIFFQRWSSTPHAFAMETLKRKGQEYNPECVVCHVVGYRNTSGFLGLDQTPHLTGVQCESCHGALQGHLQGEPVISRVHEDVCRRCHNEIHSPSFEVPHYYQRSDQCTINQNHR